MKSRQFDHLQESTRLRLHVRIPAECPLMVTRLEGGGFAVSTLDGHDEMQGRYQVVAAWLDGYVAAWRRTTRRSA